jgi:hypothetical protein
MCRISILIITIFGRRRHRMLPRMDLTVVGDQVTGNFVSLVAASPGTTFSLSGRRAGIDLIAFAVNFGLTGSLGTWAGQHTVERGVEKIVSMWHLTVNVPDDKEDAELLSSVWTGSANFYRNKPSYCP